MKEPKKAKAAYLDRSRKWPMFVIKYLDGSRRKFSKHYTWEEAERKLAEINNRIELGTFDMADYTSVRVRSAEIGQAAVEYIAEKERSFKLTNRSMRTIEKDSYSLLLFNEFIGKKTRLANIGKKDIDEFVEWLKAEKQTQYGGHHADESIRGYLRCLSAYFNWAIDRGFMLENAVTGFYKRSGYSKKKSDPKFATPEQVGALRKELAKGAAWKLDAFNFSLWTSARASEVLGVKKKDVFKFRKGDRLRIAIRFVGKGGTERMVPIGPECEALVAKRIEWLRSGVGLRAAQSRAAHPKNAELYKKRWEQGYLFHDVVHRRSLSDAVLTARRKLGIDRKITFHSARHTWATDSLGQGAPLAAISKTMGHSNVRTTEIYAQIVDDAVMNVFENVREI